MIRFEKLRKEFGTFVAVQDLDVEIPEGEIYGLIGPNGAGKTTTIRMACGLLLPTSGTATIAGVDVHREPERAQEFIGYLSDVYALYEDLKVWEYLDYFAHAYRMPEGQIKDRIEEVIRAVGLEVKHDELIKGLSRGMKQRLGLARAMLHRPKLLLLDEPASGLDPKARLDLRNLLRLLHDQGTTVVISSHILAELEGFCTSIGLMEQGRMVRSGTIDAITASEAPMREIRLSWTGGGAERVSAALAAMPNVSDVLAKGREGLFRFAGTDDELAEVVCALVAGGVPLTSFSEVRQTVEDLYMKLSHHEVM